MIRLILFFLPIISLQPVLAGAQTRPPGKVVTVRDLQMRVAKGYRTTYRELLGKIETGVKITKGAGLGEIVWQDGHRAVIEKVRALRFFSHDRERLALVVHLRDPQMTRGEHVYLSTLLVFDFPANRAALVQFKKLEDWHAAPSNLDFLEKTPVVVLRKIKPREEGFWLTIKKIESGVTELEKFSLFALDGKYVTEILSDLPPLKTPRAECGRQFKQTLDTISPIYSSAAKAGNYPTLQINVFQYPFETADCAKPSAAPATVIVYEAHWNGRHYQTKLIEPGKIGIAECDEYIEKYEICLKSKVPEKNRGGILKAMHQMRQAWKEAAATENGRRALAAGCRTALESARRTLTEFGCKW